MTASIEAKKAGLKSLSEACSIANKPRRTIERYYHDNRPFFNAIIKGCSLLKKESQTTEMFYNQSIDLMRKL